MKAFLGIDLGTTGCKAAVYSLDAKLISIQYLQIPLIKLGKQEIEQNPEDWWNLSVLAIQNAVSESASKQYQIAGMSISSQGLSFVPIDHQGNPLRNAISWLDSRAENEIKEIRNHFANGQLFQITGKRPESYYTLPKVLWLKRNEPDIFRQTAHFLLAHDYLFYKLTGQVQSDYTLAGGTMMFDLRQLHWCSHLMDLLEITPQQLPTLNWAGSKSCPLQEPVAARLGLMPGIPVTVGCQDQKCAAFGAGLEDKIATISLGTASAISVLSNQLVLDAQQRIPAFPYLYPGKWILEGVLSTSGAALKWINDTFFPDKHFVDLDHIASQSSPGSQGACFYPHLSGASSPHWDSSASGAFTGLHLATNPGDFIRSVLEGIAYQIRTNLEVITENVPVESLILFGGGAKSYFWADIICQVTNKPVKCSEIPEMANWGASLLAAKGVGEGYLEELANSQTDKHLQVYPDPHETQRYDDLYQTYRANERKILA